MNLKQQSDKLTEELFAQFSSKIVEDINLGFQEIINGELDKNSRQKGERALDFSLPNATGEIISLAEKLKKGVVILSFYRGGWCPFCNLQLRAYQQILGKIKSLGASIIAISPELPDTSLSTKEKNELEFEVLSDRGNLVAEKYGLVFVTPQAHKNVHYAFDILLPKVNGDDSWTVPIPATYIIDTDGIIVWAHTNPNYRWRAEPETILNTLQSLQTASV